MRAQRLQQIGVFGEAFHQNLARAVECCLDVGHARVVHAFDLEGFAQVFGGFGVGRERGIAKKRIRQRFQAGFLGNLRLGAALLLVRQVQVFEARLVGGKLDGGAQLRREFALLVDVGEDRSAPVFELTQVSQALFEQTQLVVVEAAGDLLAIAGDEGHGGAFIEQRDGRGHLFRARGEFDGKALLDRRQGHEVTSKAKGDKTKAATVGPGGLEMGLLATAGRLAAPLTSYPRSQPSPKNR